MRPQPTHAPLALFGLAVALGLPACTNLGSKRVAPDRFDYNQAIARSRNEQILLNLVRARYLELPAFLDVSSVLSQYTYSGTLGASADFDLRGAGDSAGVSGAIAYSEQPTISFAPMRGEEFTRRMMTPIPAEIVFALGQGGWPLDLLVPICIQRMNRVENTSFAAVADPDDNERQEEFSRVTSLFQELQRRECLEVWRDEKQTEGLRYLSFQCRSDEELALEKEVKQRLDLDPDIDVYRITGTLTRRQKDEITIQPRSFLAVLFFLARGVEVPHEHLEKGWVVPLEPLESLGGRFLPVEFAVRVQKDRPEEAFVSIRFQKHWFYVSRSDLPTKRGFAVLNFLFSLQASGTDSATPVLTIPAGR